MEKITEHPLYSVWASMKDRCNNPNHPSYPRYGGRGIMVCDRWRHDFHMFVCDMGSRPNGFLLERIDNNLGYFPKNCKWASRLEQTRNRPDFNVTLTHQGKTQLLIDWAQDLGIGIAALHNRIHLYGWTLNEALSHRKSHRWARIKA